MTTAAPVAWPAAVDEPRNAVGWSWIAAISGANFGLWLALFGPIQLLLGVQAQAISPEHKVAALGIVTAAGAVCSLVANPLFGALSDRTVSRFGRRLPWVFLGAVGGALSLVLLATAQSITMMTIAWCLAQTSLNAMFAAVVAAVPDQVPVAQRGAVGGWLGIAQILGLVCGVAAAEAALPSIAAAYLILVAILIVMTMPYLALRRDIVLDRRTRPAFAWRPFLAGFWIDPRRYPDLGWAWMTRFAINLVYAVGTLYLLYYLGDVMHRPDPAGDVVTMTAVNVVTMVLVMIPAGFLSDRLGRRKSFVVVAGILLACGMAILAAGPGWTGALIAAAILGAGFGIYTSVEFALITQVLPSAADRGRDLGVINVANALPQVLAPAIAALVVSYAGYPILYALSAGLALCGAVMIRQIRSVA
ncbi:MFS transporter [Sphingomonas alpina]|uniref:MFS transporter n=1 Tax=Sphingomonas alpina TaxID=653931 RepID=A0A7H0LPN1_9SPHN|nr:MFS transporter [Sphingomonas alpina]QNQ11634.1 MFS transporter [Sphingomonas alpina]